MSEKEPIIKIREIEEKELKEILKSNKEDIHIINTEDDIDNFLIELDKKIDKNGI